ncbi:MAG: hypothetical protein OXE92_02680 [Bacteroidetes bacterium]|nr:hypothetical protein [Bacteroidota bacterium]MCY4204614.1 hypothetical protein [Bacteroidota bacterium]
MESLESLFRPILAEAGRRAMKYFLNASFEIKQDGSPVTAADKAVQEYLLEEITREFPNDGIVAEEDEVFRKPRQGTRYWTIDPIDGTVPFMAGMPSWGIAIGLIDEDLPAAGFIYLPATGDLFYTTGAQVWRNSELRSLTEDDSLHQNSILVTHARPHQRYTLQESFPGRVFGLGTASAHLSLVATGGAHVVLIGHDKVWDLAPGYAMLSANGGILCYLDGRRCDLSDLLDGRPAPLPMLGGSEALVEETLTHLDYWSISKPQSR